MKAIETVSLIGLGSLGCAYLSKIAETIPLDRLRVIASGERAARYRAGVRINGRKYHFPVLEPGDAAEPADLVIFTVKNHHLEQAIADVRNHIGPDTVILSLLNGITSEQRIGAVYGAGRVLLSYSIKIDATRAGNEVVFTTRGLIPFGEAVNRRGEYSENVRRTEEFFLRTGIDYSIPEDMVRSLWMKFMLNAGINQVSAVLRAPYGPFQRPGEMRDLVVDAMLEVVRIAPKEGVLLTPEDAYEAVKAIDSLSPLGQTSMVQDIIAGRKTEAEVFGGTVAELGKRHGIPVPINTALLRMLRCLEVLASAGKP